MVWVWHKPGDLNCNACQTKPALKKLKGCPPYKEAEVPHQYPPGRLSAYPGKTWVLERCPVTYLSDDLSVVSRYAKVEIPFEALEAFPPPLIEAVEFFKNEMSLRDNLKLKEAYSHG